MATEPIIEIDLPVERSKMGQMALGKVTLSKQFRFEASHRLPRHQGKCSRLHGHSWVLTVEVDGYVDDYTGFVCDYGHLKELVNSRIIDVVDHQHLGQDTEGVLGASFYPSSENLILHFAQLLASEVPGLGEPWQRIRLLSLKLNETCTSECTWRRYEHRP